VEFELEGVPEGPVRGALSLPEGPLGRLPTVVILGGLDVGRESLRYVEAHGPNALIAYEYPRTAEGERAPSPALRLPRIRRAALAVPVQVQALLAWTRSQPWADPGRISLLGYSFGAMFVPACARLAEARGPALRALVMAFGGADLPALLAANARFRPAALRRPAAWAAGALVRPLEPALHLPRLRTEALFVTGLQDDRIPLACARRMQALKPIPRSVLDLDEGHMDPGLPERNRRIVGASQAWLVSRGALAPAP
jgi:dienelactone hydrolase